MPSISDKNPHGLHLDKTSKVNKPLIFRKALRKVEWNRQKGQDVEKLNSSLQSKLRPTVYQVCNLATHFVKLTSSWHMRIEGKNDTTVRRIFIVELNFEQTQ